MINFASSSGPLAGPAHASQLDLPVTILPLRDESISATVRRLEAAVKDLDGTIVTLTAFGPCEAASPTVAALRRFFGKVDFPLTWAEGLACETHGLAGLQAVVLPAAHVARVEMNGKVVGSVFESSGLRHCLLGGITPDGGPDTRWEQTQQTFNRVEEALSAAGFILEDLVRTWFFLDEILYWYKLFNDARTQVYSNVAFRTGSSPASTGVGAKNPGGAALTVAAWAVQPVNGSVGAFEVGSPLQCSACAYGSSFSRAMEIKSQHHTRLLISGTASIAPHGETIWSEDAHGQIKQTMQVVSAILRSRGFGFCDITRATAYFKRRELSTAFDRWRMGCEWGLINPVKTRCDICRDDLLFEFEADASK